MRHIFLFLAIATLNIHSLVSFGQSTLPSKPVSKIPEPLYIFNSNIIGNGLITKLNPKDFKSVIVYRGQEGPSVLNNLTSASVLSITYDGQIDSKSFAEIGLQNGLQGPIGVVLNGRKLSAEQSSTLRIAPEAIGQLRITPAVPGASEAIVSIQIVESTTNNQRHAPGTIMIR
jgi:hypothetical protein